MRAASSNLLRVASAFILTAHLGSNCAAATDSKYSNVEYGYSIALPKSASPVEAPPPAPQHGVAIDLPSGGQIWVDGSYDATFHGSASAALKQLLDESGVKTTQPVKRARVGNLEAARASYEKGQVVSTRVVAYRPREQAIAIIYTFGLDTTRPKQSWDGKVFEKIVRSFSVAPLPE